MPTAVHLRTGPRFVLASEIEEAGEQLFNVLVGLPCTCKHDVYTRICQRCAAMVLWREQRRPRESVSA